jgi:hypothetical protein
MFKFLKTISISFVTIFSVLSLVSVSTFAQSLTDFQLLNFNNIEELLNAITTFLVDLAPVLAGLVLIYGGYLYFLGGFDQKADGKKAIQAAVIGLVIILSYDIIKTLITGSIAGGTLNVKPISDFLIGLTKSLTSLSSVVAIGVIIYGGYKYMFSPLPGAKGDGKEAITNGIIGLIAIIIAGPIIQLVKDTVSGTTTTDIATDSIQNFILNIINNLLIPVSSIITIFFFVVGGYNMLTAGGNDSQYKKGLDYLRNAVIGLVVVLISFTLTQIVIYVVQGLKIGA